LSIGCKAGSTVGEEWCRVEDSLAARFFAALKCEKQKFIDFRITYSFQRDQNDLYDSF
jgi:hypothetical protein